MEDKQALQKERVKQNYIKKITENPEYRNVLNNRTKARQQKQREGTEPKPRGRPKTAEPKQKKPNGRPKKYNIDVLPPISSLI